MENPAEPARPPMAVLATLDRNYLPQLQVLLTSLAVNNPGEVCTLYLLHSAIPEADLVPLRLQCRAYGYGLEPIRVEESLFRDAPVTRQYPREMYYRLLAPHLLPRAVDRVLYLDPDILVINSLRPLWQTDLQGHLLGAAAHTGKAELASGVNQMRLGTGGDYYNSGVLLMDLDAGRREIVPGALFAYVARHRRELLLPDQDLLNALYGQRILPLSDVRWNYDARNYSSYLLRSGGVCDLPWVLEHTAILHFCGKEKPWHPHYWRRFGVLYRHYMQLTRNRQERLAGQTA